jgi:hypothetical protein
MAHKILGAAVAFGVLLCGARAVEAAPPKEPLVDQVRKSIEQGISYLKAQERDGRWERNVQLPGGETCLAMLALLNCGVKPEEPIIQRGLRYVRSIEPQNTYVVALQTMVLAEAKQKEDLQRIKKNADWLLKARVLDRDGKPGGAWTYQMNLRARDPDNSNTQYAVLGLHAAKSAGVPIDRHVWEAIRKYYIDCQADNGSWGYNPHRGVDERLTMTTAGLCGLLISGLELNERREVLHDGAVENCGQYKENKNVASALDWIGHHFNPETRNGIYYNIYGLERAGRLSGQRFFGDRDWYREGCEYLVRRQDKALGCWQGGPAHYDNWPIVSTSFALLFLSKGRTPVLISKLVHGPGQDWNNDRNDAKNLVEYASRELFQRQPMAWQAFDAKRVDITQPDDMEYLTAELLQSPIVYITGHQAPKLTENEKDLLRKYVEQGGFILAEACCDRQEFTDGFLDLMKDRKLFPDNKFELLKPEHPIWRAHAEIAPGDQAGYPLVGMEWGCKTVIVLSPKDLSCRWESNQMNDGRSKLAFRLGGNIIAYATGMEPPKPRLTPVEVIKSEREDKIPPRGYLTVAQVNCQGERPAKQAVRNLMLHLRRHARLDVALNAEEKKPADEDLADYRFLYMHGRGEFTFTDEEVDRLRRNLETGGLLFADACCGSKAFDASFRKLVQRLSGGKQLELIKPGDDLFSKDINGVAIELVRCRREAAGGQGMEPEFRDVPPYLEGIKIKNRWVIIYSKYDIGCALETPTGRTPGDCLGHDFGSAVKLASAAVLYALKR